MKRLSTLLPALLVGALTLTGGAQDPAPDADEPRAVVGAEAPTIRLNDHEGRATTVGDQRDTWTILAFFPKAATPG